MSVSLKGTSEGLEKSRRMRKGKEKAVEHPPFPLPHLIPLPSSDDGHDHDRAVQPQASSSKLPAQPQYQAQGESSAGKTKKIRKSKVERIAERAARVAQGLPARPEVISTPKKQRHDRPPIPLGPTPKQLRKENASSSDSAEWECIPVAENEVSRVPPIWSKDRRFYFSVAGSSVHIRSSTEPEYKLLSSLSAHSKPITGMHLHPTHPLQLITSSEDGTVIIWDWVEGRIIRTIEVGPSPSRIYQSCIGKVLDEFWVFCTVAPPHPKKQGSCYVQRVSLAPTTKSKPFSYLVGKLSSIPASLIISPQSRYLVALAANKAYAYRFPTTVSAREWKPSSVKFVSDQVFTCGAFSPESIFGNSPDWFATGDVKGVIRLWHGLDDAFRQLDAAASKGNGAELNPETEKRLPTTSLHWHAHAVAAIAFTSSGTQLLSVGEESVLVQWHLASGKREYVPRLGGRPIISLAVKPSLKGGEQEWWMCLADGAVIKVGEASGHISTVGQGIKIDPLRPSTTAAYPQAIHPSTSSLVVPSSHPSTLQFIDTSTSSVLFDLEVAPSNRVSRRDEKELVPVAVEHVAFSGVQGGKSLWMATVEGRAGDQAEGGGLVRNLKIWKWDGHRYTINTQLPRPHGAAQITSIHFSPIAPGTSPSISPYLLTCSSDGVAKIWHVRQAKKSEHGKVSAKKTAAFEHFWATRSTFNYRSMPIHDATFSPDGTMLSLVHGPVVTLWDVEGSAILRTLDAGLVGDLRKVAFIGTEGRWLVAIGQKTGLIVWDLLSCEVSWSSPTQQARHLLALPTSSSFIITYPLGSHKTFIQIFSPSLSSAIETHTIEQSLLTLTHWPTSSRVSPLQFLAVATSGEIYRFGQDMSGTPANTASSITNGVSDPASQKSTSIWQEMFGKDTFLDQHSGAAASQAQTPTLSISALQAGAKLSGRPSDIFEGASHTLPPVGLLFDAFMDEFLAGAAPKAKDGLVREDAVSYGVDDTVSSAVVGESVNGVQSGGSHIKEKRVTDEEIKELEAFFKQVLSNPRPVPTPAKVNGNSHAHSTPKMSNGQVGKHTLINGFGATPNNSKSQSKAKEAAATKETEAELSDDAEIETPKPDSKKGRGTKRKAVKEV